MYKIFKYKLTAKSGGNSHLKRKSLDSFIANYLVNESKLTVRKSGRRSVVDLVYNSKTIRKLVPKKCFPISNPNMIIFYQNDSKDFFAISDYTKLDSNSKEVLASALDVNSFDPIITGIKDIKITGDGLEWYLKTKKGDMKFVTKSRSDIVTIGKYVVIIDEFNTPLKIDASKLDKNSLDVLATSI